MPKWTKEQTEAIVKSGENIIVSAGAGSGKTAVLSERVLNKIENNINTIEKGLENNKLMLLKDINLFDTMYDKNLDYFKEISLYIIAGERKIEELKTKVLPELKKKAQESNDQIEIQKVNDMENQINRFEKKIYDLKTTRIISIQMAPQIRLLQNNDALLVEKIQSSITNTIPLWKNQIVLALGINNSKKALKGEQAVSKLTNEMLKKNSETLKQGSIDIAKEVEKSIVDIETLKKDNKSIAIITKTDVEAADIYKLLKRDLKDLALINTNTKFFTRELVVLPSYMAKGLEFDATIVYTKKDNKYNFKYRYKRIKYSNMQ